MGIEEVMVYGMCKQDQQVPAIAGGSPIDRYKRYAIPAIWKKSLMLLAMLEPYSPSAHTSQIASDKPL